MSFDRRTLLVVALCLLVLVAYPYLLKLVGLERHMRPPAPPPTVVTPDTSAIPDRAATPAPPAPPDVSPSPTAEIGALPLPAAPAEIERAVRIDTPLYRAEFSSRGARLVSVELKRYATARGEGGLVRVRPGESVPAERRVVLAGGPAFGVDLGSNANLVSLDQVMYAVAESLDADGAVRAVTFTADGDQGLRLRQTYRARPDSYALDLEVEILSLDDLRITDYSLTTRSWPLLNEARLKDEEQALRATSLVGANVHREGAGGLRKGPRRFEGNARWTGVQTRYFLAAIAVVDGIPRAAVSHLDARALTPAQRRLLPPDVSPRQEVAVSSLVLAAPGAEAPVNRFLLYVGPTEYFALSQLGLGLERVVDLGWSWIQPFSRGLLRLMVWLNGLLHNYGLAILVLATLVRLILHPLNMISMRSMRAMQRLQPEMERLKQKHKNDPQAMNAAVMALYKEHKVNPAGGCLPLLLQMPLFIALYTVLFNAIELRQAPFVAWIDDLSAPDLLFPIGPFPVRVLPLLMAATGILSQRLTPTDPRQASMMYMMNVVMLVIFYELPSGLVLYWTVMNLLTAVQQWMVLRHDGQAAAPAVPVAPAAPVAQRPVAKRRSRK